MTEFIPSMNGKGYREVRTPADEERAIIEPHYVWEDSGPRVVYPASGSTLGMLVEPKTNGLQACLRLDYAHAPSSLMQILNVDELRSLAEGMLDIANQMEAHAADMLAAALKRKPNG